MHICVLWVHARVTASQQEKLSTRGGYLLTLGKYDGFMIKVRPQCFIIYAGLDMLKNHWSWFLNSWISLCAHVLGRVSLFSRKAASNCKSAVISPQNEKKTTPSWGRGRTGIKRRNGQNRRQEVYMNMWGGLRDLDKALEQRVWTFNMRTLVCVLKYLTSTHVHTLSHQQMHVPADHISCQRMWTLKHPQPPNHV